MKTRDARPEKRIGRGAESDAAKPEMTRFRALAKDVLSADKEAVLKEEERERKRKRRD